MTFPPVPPWGWYIRLSEECLLKGSSSGQKYNLSNTLVYDKYLQKCHFCDSQQYFVHGTYCQMVTCWEVLFCMLRGRGCWIYLTVYCTWVCCHHLHILPNCKYICSWHFSMLLYLFWKHMIFTTSLIPKFKANALHLFKPNLN